MATIEQQLELERSMIERGKELYRLGVKNAEEQGRGHDTTAARKLMQEFIEPLAIALEEWINAGKSASANGLYRPLLRVCDPQIAIYLALYKMFDSFGVEQSIATTAAQIGQMVEDELRFTAFKSKFSDYYDEILKDFKRKGTENYRHKHRVLTHKANENEDGWIEWAHTERVGVGMKLLDIILTNTDLVQKIEFYRKGKIHYRLEPTLDAQEWMDKHHELQELMRPVRMPCIIEPDPWTSIDQGGYYSPELRTRTKMVKFLMGQKKKHAKYVADNIGPLAFEAVNSVQKTPWRVNERVLDVAREVWARNLAIGMPHKEKLDPGVSPVVGIPKEELTPEQEALLEDWKHEAAAVYTAEKTRIAKSFQITGILKTANEYRNLERFWYVWSLDFRGRMYAATSGFSPQGPDVAKGVIQFANGKPLGRDGMYWLMVNIANRYGYDKEDYDVRVLWVHERHDHWMAVANDPLSNREYWANADKPYQMLAAIFEYADAHNQKSIGIPVEEYVSYIPIGLDGSCNGLQNFSAMLRDPVGGAATNLVPAPKPADIYSAVGNVCAGKVRRIEPDTLTDEQRISHMQWMQFMDAFGKGTLPRKIPKRPVMTQPYGATRQSCTTYIHEGINEVQGKDKSKHIITAGKFKAATFLTPYLWASIGEVVVAARVAMDWLQKCAGIIAKNGDAVRWMTADGFPVYQAIFKQEDVRVRTQLAGDLRLRLRQPTDKLDSRGMRSAVSPNFVHSMDATHLRETVRRCHKLGITDLACIHDDYGTHACNTTLLHSVIREAFISIYTENDPLHDFRKEQEGYGHDLPEVPPKGDLDINLVRQSKFFFG